jgi:hypothetical protein
MIRNTVKGTYLPKPIARTRVVSPKKAMVVEMPEFSIRINMNTLEAFNEEKTKEEEETIETLTSFVPLSATPMPGALNEDHMDIRDRIRSEEEMHDAHLLANRKVQTQSRWKIWSFLILLFLGIWMSFVVINTSLDNFLTNPIEATASIFRGDLRQSVEVKQEVKRVKSEVWVDRQGGLGNAYFAQGIVQITKDMPSLPTQVIVSITCQDGKVKTEYLSTFIYLDELNEESILLFKEEQAAYKAKQEMTHFKPAQVIDGDFQFSYVYPSNEECTVQRIELKLL